MIRSYKPEVSDSTRNLILGRAEHIRHDNAIGGSDFQESNLMKQLPTEDSKSNHSR